MNFITKIIAIAFGMMCLFARIQTYAQGNIKVFNINEQSILKKLTEDKNSMSGIPFNIEYNKDWSDERIKSEIERRKNSIKEIEKRIEGCKNAVATLPDAQKSERTSNEHEREYTQKVFINALYPDLIRDFNYQIKQLSDGLSRREVLKKEEEENKKSETTTTKEIEDLKNKLQNQSNNAGKVKADDFWSGGADKNTASKGNDDFWSGGKDKTASNDGGSDIEVVNKDGRIYLKDTYDIIKEWDVNKYTAIRKIEGSNDFFKLYVRTQGNGFLSRNNFVIVDKQGKTVKIDGEETFEYITAREGGGYTIMKYLSESYYEGKEERFPKVKDWYTSSSEAISDVEKDIERIRKDILEERKGNRPGTVYFVASYTFHVVEVKEIITNAKMQSVMTKTGFKVR